MKRIKYPKFENPKWVYRRISGGWEISDKYEGFNFMKNDIPNFPIVKLPGGKCRLFPIYCHHSGDQIGWRTVVPKNYPDNTQFLTLSLRAVSKEGKVLVKDLTKLVLI